MNEHRISKYYLIRLLDSEINRIENKGSKTGITPWVIYAALSGLIWLLFKEIEIHSVDFEFLSIMVVLFIFIYDITVYIVNIENKKLETDKDLSPRFYYANVYAGERLKTTLFVLTKYFIVGMILYKTLFSYEKYILSIPIIFCSIITLFTMLLIILKPFQIPIKTNPETTKVTRNITYFSLLSIIIAIVSLSQIITDVGFNISTLKISMIITAIFILIEWICNEIIEQSPIIHTLIRIKRDLIFGKIDNIKAAQEIDIALSGLTVSMLFQKEIELLMRLSSDMNAIVLSIETEFEAMKNLYKKIITSENEDGLNILLKTAMNSIISNNKNYKLLHKDYRKVFERTERKIKNLVFSWPDSSLEVSQIVKQISTNTNEYINNYIALSDKIEKFSQSITPDIH